VRVAASHRIRTTFPSLKSVALSEQRRPLSLLRSSLRPSTLSFFHAKKIRPPQTTLPEIFHKVGSLNTARSFGPRKGRIRGLWPSLVTGLSLAAISNTTTGIRWGDTSIGIINGHVMVVLIDEDATKAKSKGLIGPQYSGPAGTRISFRNIRIRTIS
jgi:hypothetical protein